MNIACDVIKDILPLFHDDVCSIESKVMVEEHLKSCVGCRNYLNSINDEVFQNSSSSNIDQVRVNSLRSLKKKLFKKSVVVVAISVLCAVAILLGGFSLTFHHQIPIEYEDGLVNVELLSDGAINVYFLGDDYYCSYEFTKIIEKDGIEQEVAFVYFTDTIWTKYLSKSHKTEDYQFSLSNSIMVDYGKGGESIEPSKEIAAAYYLVGDYATMIEMSNEEFENEMKDAVLMWEK